jgi:hypothetical protein
VVSALRFFMVAPLHSPHMLAALGTVLFAGCATLLLDPAKGADVLAPVALLQMFAASSGFAIAARRGYADLLLTAGAGRINIALTHMALSVAPGLLVWMSLGLVEMVVARTMMPRAFASGSIAYMVLVSALAWAISVPLPPLSGGLVWLLTIAVWFVAGDKGRFVCPFTFLGRDLSYAHAPGVFAATVVAAVAVAGAVIWVTRMDVPLESAQ